MAKIVHLIAIGKLKDKELLIIEQHYLKQIKNPPLNIYEIKACAENPDKEAESVCKKIQEITNNESYKLFLLAEKGKLFDSPNFSQWLYHHLETVQSLIFVLGGVQGHGKSLLKLPHEKISLSPMTFPHMLARILFVEQYYRAQTINNKHPYHY